MAETVQVENSSKQESNSTTAQDNNMHQNHQQNDTQEHLEEESPLGIKHKNKSIPAVKGEVVSSEYVDSEDVMAEFLDQDPIEKGLTAPLLVTPAGIPVIMDHQGFISPGAHPSHMFVPPEDVQSKGLPSDGVPVSMSPPPPMQRDELKIVLMHQLEYYFSKDNLGSDKYLLSQMDGDNFVPVNIVANFNQVKRLSADLDLIIEVVKESPVLQLDDLGDKVRAIPEKRCILILREIPQETPQKDIMALFSGGKCPKFLSCEFAENSCWYVTFESEEDAHKAFSFLREEVRTFLGQPIRARIKGTAVQRSSGMPKKPRVNYPVQPMYNGTAARLQYYQQQSGMIPWSSPPSTSATAPNGTPYYDRNNFYIPSNGYAPPQFGPPTRFQNSFPQPASGGRTASAEVPERGRAGPPGGRVQRGDRALSPPLVNGDAFPERERALDRGSGNARSGPRGEHLRGDHYGGSSNGTNVGPNGDKPRYSRDDQRKIPRYNKNRHISRPPTNGGPVSNGGKENGDKEKNQPPLRQTRLQQNLDLAPVHFPPLPTTDNGSVSSAPTTTPNVEGESKGVSNLADIVKGRRLKEGVPPLSSNGHPPLQQSSSSNGTSTLVSNQGSESINNNTVGSSPAPVSQASENPTSKSVASNTTQTNAQSVPTAMSTSSSTNPTNPPSIAAVVANNIPPPPRTISQVVSATTQSNTSSSVATVSTTSGPSSTVTTAASVVASGVQSTVTASTAVSGNPSGHHGQTHGHTGGHGRQYQSKGQRNDSKGREGKPYYNNGGKQGSTRYGDKDTGQNRQSNPRNSQVSKDGRSAPPNKRSRDRDRDRDRRQGGGSNYRNFPSKPSPKPPKKHQPPQAPPPPPTPTHKIKTPPTPKVDTGNCDSVPEKSQSDGKSDKLSYAQMAQRKKALHPPVPPPPPPPKHNTNENPSETQPQSSTKAASAPTSPQGSKSSLVSNNTKTSSGQSSINLKPVKPKSSNQKPSQNTESSTGQSTDTGGSVLPTPINPATVSKSAPTSPCKESVNVKIGVNNTLPKCKAD